MSRLSSLFGSSSAPFHSSGIRQEGGHGGLGSTSPETFAKRKHVERNRSLVDGYKHAIVHRNDEADIRSSRSGVSRQTMDVVRPSSGTQRPGSSAISSAPKPSFREPTTRKYNPYG